MDERKTCYRGFGFVTFADEISAKKASKKVHMSIGYLHRSCVSKCYAAIVGNGPIGTYVGCPASKERASGVPYTEWFGLLSVTYGLSETQEFMDERSKQRKA